jgi:hypothetical protein
MRCSPFQSRRRRLDVTNDGRHVGEPQFDAVLQDAKVPFGIFSHMLEAGGRAVDDIDGASAVTLPMKTGRKRRDAAVNLGRRGKADRLVSCP